MADRTPGGKEVDERTGRLKIKRLQYERKQLEAALLGAEINIEELLDSITRREQQIVETTAKIEELKKAEQEATNG